MSGGTALPRFLILVITEWLAFNWEGGSTKFSRFSASDNRDLVPFFVTRGCRTHEICRSIVSDGRNCRTKAANLPLQFRTLYEMSVAYITADPRGLKHALQRVLFNQLVLDMDELEAGYHDCEGDFLCAEIDDDGLHWNGKETEW